MIQDRVLKNLGKKKRDDQSTGDESDLDGDGGGVMTGIIGDDNVVTQNDDVVVNFLGNALGPGGLG